ncbi:uncharacterized protein G2W53_030946 [Senna tora]|uniref:Uncharacterized protein n=1 Tax=Senna tora TaxID=362788 RepID=A0A834T9X6_9FABA|nr:uncharacterized protein G2W53_030946 [Senna tora]
MGMGSDWDDILDDAYIFLGSAYGSNWRSPNGS